MNDRGSNPDHTSAYVLVPATSVAEGNLIEFATPFWPDRSSCDRFLSSWWRRAEPHCAVAAVHQETDAMVGLCGGRPCEWSIGGQSYSSVAICDWYVAPNHAGKSIGKRMVQHFQRPDRMLYSISISDVAIASFQRLGWVDRTPLRFWSRRCPLWRCCFVFPSSARRSGFQRPCHRRRNLLGPIAADLDRIEASRARGTPAHMRRGSKEWMWRLSVCGDRSYRFCIVRRAGAAVGYAVVRRMGSGRLPLLRNRTAAMITDLVAVDDDTAVLQMLARRALAIAGELGAVAILTVTTSPAHRRALAASGFVSPAYPLIGRVLRRRAPVYMWLPEGPAAELKADGMTLTLADAAIDFDL